VVALGALNPACIPALVHIRFRVSALYARTRRCSLFDTSSGSSLRTTPGIIIRETSFILVAAVQNCFTGLARSCVPRAADQPAYGRLGEIGADLQDPGSVRVSAADWSYADAMASRGRSSSSDTSLMCHSVCICILRSIKRTNLYELD
jgi:hypothetical protein